MKKALIPIFIVILIITAFFIKETYFAEKKIVTADNPEDAIKDFIYNAQDKEYDIAIQLVDKDMTYKQKTYTEDLFKKQMQTLTKNNTVSSVKTIDTKIEGVRAIVRYELKYTNSQIIRRTADLILKKGNWYVIFDENRLDEVPEPSVKDITGLWYCKNNQFSYYIIDIVKEGKIYKIRDKTFDSDILYDSERDTFTIQNKPIDDYILARQTDKGGISGKWLFQSDNVIYDMDIQKKNSNIYTINRKITNIIDHRIREENIIEETFDCIYDKETNKLYDLSFGMATSYEDEFVWRKLGGTLTGEKVDKILRPITYYNDLTNKVYHNDKACTRIK